MPRDFQELLIDIGNGHISNDDGEVQLEPSFVTSVSGQDKLIDTVYPQVA